MQKTYTLIASGGSGITLQLNNKSNFGTPIISAIEILADDPYGVAAPTFNLDLSGDNGATWTPLAANQPVDRFGRGSYTWTVPANQPLGSQYLVRVTSNDGIHAQDVLTRPFLITNNGHDYYVNDNSQTGDIFTTVAGDNLSSGKRPDQPMANLAALLAAYALGPGDVVHVDTGTYDLVRNIVVTAQNSGVRIEGPGSATALFRRGVTGGSSHFPAERFGTLFDLRQATNVTLDHLSMTNAYAGIYAADNAGATGLTVTNSSIYGMGTYGVFLGQTNDFATLSGNTLYGLPGGGGRRRSSVWYLSEQ